MTCATNFNPMCNSTKHAPALLAQVAVHGERVPRVLHRDADESGGLGLHEHARSPDRASAVQVIAVHRDSRVSSREVLEEARVVQCSARAEPLLLLILAGCGEAPAVNEAGSPIEAGSGDPDSAVVVDAGSDAPSDAREEKGEVPFPALDEDFPDPFVLRAGGTYHAYATNAGSLHVQHASSTDLVHWSKRDDALPKLGSWPRPASSPGRQACSRSRTEKYVLFYADRKSGTGEQCIGRATSSKPEGPSSMPSARR